MKALYMRGSTQLSQKERETYAGYRIENADAFSSVANGITSAVVAGDYPEIEKALAAKEIKPRKAELEADKAERLAVEAEEKARADAEAKAEADRKAAEDAKTKA